MGASSNNCNTCRRINSFEFPSDNQSNIANMNNPIYKQELKYKNLEISISDWLEDECLLLHDDATPSLSSSSNSSHSISSFSELSFDFEDLVVRG